MPKGTDKKRLYMLILNSKAVVCDNSGALFARCIKVLKGSSASIGDTILVVVDKTTPNSNIASGSIQRAVVCRTKKEKQREDGSLVRFDHNSVALVNKQNMPVGTRVFGACCNELRSKGHIKLATLASALV